MSDIGTERCNCGEYTIETCICGGHDYDRSKPREYPDDITKAACEVCKALGVASTPENAKPIMDALVAERRCNDWQPIATAPSGEGAIFLACNAGSIERWHPHEEATVITVNSSPRAFICYRSEDGFVDEFGDFYGHDGLIADAEYSTAEDDVLRLTRWMPIPATPIIEDAGSGA